MDSHSKQHLIETYIGAYNQFDIDKMMSVLHDDVRFENVQDGTISSSAETKQDFRRLAEQAKEVFSSREQTILDTHYGDAIAEVYIDYVGVLAHDQSNGLKAGTPLEMKGRTEFAFRDGLISLVRDIC
jgi:hypothetical protein